MGGGREHSIYHRRTHKADQTWQGLREPLITITAYTARGHPPPSIPRIIMYVGSMLMSASWLHQKSQKKSYLLGSVQSVVNGTKTQWMFEANW